MNNQQIGIVINGSFDRILTKERKKKDGSFFEVYFLSVVCRDEQETKIHEIQIKDKDKDKYSKFKQGDFVSIPVRVSGWFTGQFVLIQFYAKD